MSYFTICWFYCPTKKGNLEGKMQKCKKKNLKQKQKNGKYKKRENTMSEAQHLKIICASKNILFIYII